MARVLAFLVVVAAAVVVVSCDSGEEAAVQDASVNDVKVDVQGVAAPAPGVREADQPNVAQPAPAATPRPAQPAPAPVENPMSGPNPVADSPFIAGPSIRQPSAADPVAHKRNFHIAWLRVSMPTGGPGTKGTVSAVFAPKAGGANYWKVVDSEVLCPTGEPSVRGTNLKDIDCGNPTAVVEPEPAP